MVSNSIVLEDEIYSAIASITGIEKSNLEKDMHFEGDLGLDSIKMVTLMNEIVRLIPEEELSIFTREYPVEALMSLQTIGEVLDIFCNGKDKKNPLPTPQNSDECFINDDPVFEKSYEELSIIDAQYPFLVSYWAVGTLSLVSTMTIEGRFDKDLFTRSWEMLVNRHPMLRAAIEIPSKAEQFKDYRMLLKNSFDVPEIPVLDHSDRSSNEQDLFLKEKIEMLINTQFKIDEWPSQQFFIQKRDEETFTVIHWICHIFADGMSCQQLLQEFVHIYSSHLASTPIELEDPISVSAYNASACSVNSYESEEEKEILRAYIAAQKNSKFSWNPLNGKSKESFADVRFITRRTPSRTYQALLNTSKKKHISLYPLISSAFLKTAFETQNQDKDVIINLPTSGRVYPTSDLTKIIGCFAQNMAISFEHALSKESWDDLIKKVNEKLVFALVNGIDRTQVKEAAYYTANKIMLSEGKLPKSTAALVRSTLKSNLYLSFVGDTGLSSRQNGHLSIKDYWAYTSTNSAGVDVLIEIFDENINISANYDASFFEKSTIEWFMEKFLMNLNNVAQGEITPLSDESDTSELEISETIEEIVSSVLRRRLNSIDKRLNLATELSIDSLSRIRIITNISKIYKNVDKALLYQLESIEEIIKEVANAYAVSQCQCESGYDKEIPFLHIADRCEKIPDAPAILFEKDVTTYEHLHRQSNKISRLLKDKGIQRGSYVGIMVHPGSHMLIGMLGILKTGAAYVPIEPVFPNERIKYILNHTQIDILLTEGSVLDTLSSSIVEDTPLMDLISLDSDSTHGVFKDQVTFKNRWNVHYSSKNIIYVSQPEDTMVVLYTSGSTGKPKGVELTHQGYDNRLKWHQKEFSLAPGERVAQKTSCCFDVSIWEIFWPLMTGGVVCPAPKETVKNPWLLAGWLNDVKINVMHFVPSHFKEFLSAVEGDAISFNHLRTLIFSGEVLPISYIKNWRNTYGPKVTLTNLYGPTEASIDVTAYTIEKIPSEGDVFQIPIGRSIDNVCLKILDENFKELSNDNKGELIIGGVQIASGYLNDSEKTKSAFIKNTFEDIPGEYIYRTGDLCSKRSDGNILFHGRMDDQVKIRGFRVELGEIETLLQNMKGINEAAVIVKEFKNKDKQIIAFVAGKNINERSIMDELAKHLPDYMMPHAVIEKISLPKNHNFKLDKSQLKHQLNDDMVTDKIDRSRGNEKKIDLKKESSFPLGPAQKWILAYFDYPYQWTGYTRFLYKQPIDMTLFKKAIHTLLDTHSVLRTVFTHVNGGWAQTVLKREDLAININLYDGRNHTPEKRKSELFKIINETINSLRIDKYPLWKVILVKVDDSQYDIAFVGHHMLSDIITNNLLFMDIWKIYGGLLKGGDDVEFKARRSYQDYIEYFEKDELKKELALSTTYWKNKLSQKEATLNFPMDYRKGPNDEGSSLREKIVFSKEKTLFILKNSKTYFHSNLYPILLAPLYRLFKEKTKQHTVAISHRMNGRDLGKGVSFFDVVGNFAVNFPVIVQLSDKPDWKKMVSAIKEEIESVPLNGVSYDLISESFNDAMYPDTQITPIRANYLGNRTLPQSEVFEFFEDELDQRFSPKFQKRMSILEFFFFIKDDQLNIHIEYSRNNFKKETIEALGSTYSSFMGELIQEVKAACLPSKSPVIQFSKDGGNKAGSATYHSLKGKVALITGAGRGLGQAIAQRFSEESADLGLIARTSSQLEDTKAIIREVADVTVLTIPADVSDYDTVAAAVEKVIHHFGRIDILVNNAGITNMLSLMDSSPKEWKRIIEVNLFGVFHMCHAVIGHMIKQQSGKIINIGSDSSFIGYPLLSAYASSKHGLLGLTKSLSEELKMHNVQVNAICPALMDTQMAPAAFKNNSMSPKKVADTASFLASSDADFITGESIKVYGTQDLNWFGSRQLPMLQASLNQKKQSV